MPWLIISYFFCESLNTLSLGPQNTARWALLALQSWCDSDKAVASWPWSPSEVPTVSGNPLALAISSNKNVVFERTWRYELLDWHYHHCHYGLLYSPLYSQMGIKQLPQWEGIVRHPNIWCSQLLCIHTGHLIFGTLHCQKSLAGIICVAMIGRTLKI